MNVRSIVLVGTATSLGFASAIAQAGLADLFHNTGEGLAVGAVDSYYELTDINGSRTPSIVTANNAAWWANDSTSTWISPGASGDTNWPTGTYQYKYTFDLTGYDLSKVKVFGEWASDNGAKLYLNGKQKSGIPQAKSGQDDSYWNPVGFSLTSDFKKGKNTLVFLVDNADGGSGANPTGLRVQFDKTKTTIDSVPEPFTMTLMLGGIGLAVRRFRK